MKKQLLFLILSLAPFFAAKAQIKYVQGSFKPYETIETTMSGNDMGHQVMTASMIDFPMDWNGNDYCALVRVKVDYMSNDDIKKMTCNAENGKHISQVEFKMVSGRNEMWVFVEKGKEIDLTFSHPTYGHDRVSGLKLAPKGMYQIVIRNSKRITLNFTTTPDGVAVTLDGENIGVTPCSKTDVTYGKHFVEYHNVVTGKRVSENITVDDNNTLFDKDMQQTKQITFTSKGKDETMLYIDGKAFGSLPRTVPVTYGAHTFVGVHNEIRDTANFEINDFTEATYNFEIIKSKYIEFFGIYNNGRVKADLYIDDEKQENWNTPISLKIPYGRHSVRMSYYNSTKKGKLVVNEKTPSDYTLIIPPRNVRWDPFNIEYRKRIFGLTAGYVSKWWSYKNEGASTKYNFWASEGKSMSGIQVGIPIQPLFGYGFGMSTGAYIEYYFSNSNGEGSYDSVEDLELYIPVHFMYRLPIAEEFSIFVNGGVGMDLGLSLKYKNDDSTSSYEGKYGENGAPDAFNLAGEFGGGLQWKALQISANYSIGLLDNNKMFIDADENPVSVRPMGSVPKSVSFYFGEIVYYRIC